MPAITNKIKPPPPAIINLPSHGFLAAVCFLNPGPSAVAAAGIVVDMIIQNMRSGGQTDLTFTVPMTDFDRAMEIERQVAEEIGAEAVLGDPEIAKVSVVGVGMKNHSGVASLMFTSLADENINIRLISTSEIRISCVVTEKYAELAVRVLHTAFGLDRSC